jgi:DNA polymerase (family X)
MNAEYAAPTLQHLARHSERAELAGSLRRGLDSDHDIDVVIVPGPDTSLLLPPGATLTLHSALRFRATLACGTPLDCVFTTPEAWGAAMLFYTGSKGFNIRCRSIARRRGMLLSEYGLFDVSNGRRVLLAGATEEEVLDRLFGKWISPERRQ